MCCPEDRDHSMCRNCRSRALALCPISTPREAPMPCLAAPQQPHSCRAPRSPGCHCAIGTLTCRAAGLDQAGNSHPPNEEGMTGVSRPSLVCIAPFPSCFGGLMCDPALMSYGGKARP